MIKRQHYSLACRLDGLQIIIFHLHLVNLIRFTEHHHLFQQHNFHPLPKQTHHRKAHLQLHFCHNCNDTDHHPTNLCNFHNAVRINTTISITTTTIINSTTSTNTNVRRPPFTTLHQRHYHNNDHCHEGHHHQIYTYNNSHHNKRHHKNNNLVQD